MKNIILAFAATATVGSLTASIHLACLENPTDIQKQLSTTTNAIAVAGTTAIFGLLDDEDNDKAENDKGDGSKKSDCQTSPLSNIIGTAIVALLRQP